MSELIIYHNGACTKSNGALEMLIAQNIPHTVRWYMAEPFTQQELSALLAKLGMQPSELVRNYEQLFVEKYTGKFLSEEEWLKALLENPELIQRPILEKDGKAIIARPAERIQEMIWS